MIDIRKRIRGSLLGGAIGDALGYQIEFKQRVVGYKDLGNGYFEEQTERVPVYKTYYETEYHQEPVYRSQPVYRKKYYYEIDKWLHDRYLSTSGIDSKPCWPDTSNLKSNERTGQKTSKFTFSGTDDKGNFIEKKSVLC